VRKTVLILSILMLTFGAFAKEEITNQKIYEKLLELEKRQIKLETTLQMFMEQTNKRFEDMNRRFEDINRRFEDINRRFEQLYTFLWIITGIFTTLTLGVLGFAYWDRRTIIRKAKEETIETLEREGKLRNLIEALRELAKEDKKLADVLRQFNLL